MKIMDEQTGRLIIEASTGAHGDVALKLAEAWSVMAAEVVIKTEDEERAEFEMRVYSDFFIRSVKFTDGRTFADSTNTTKAELCARDDKGQYVRNEVGAMWHGWRLAKGMIR